MIYVAVLRGCGERVSVGDFPDIREDTGKFGSKHPSSLPEPLSAALRGANSLRLETREAFNASRESGCTNSEFMSAFWPEAHILGRPPLRPLMTLRQMLETQR